VAVAGCAGVGEATERTSGEARGTTTVHSLRRKAPGTPRLDISSTLKMSGDAEWEEDAVGGDSGGEEEEVRVGPGASAKFGAAFAKILGKRDAAEASGHLGGLDRLEVRTQKAVRIDKKDDGAFLGVGSSRPRAVREGRRLGFSTPPPPPPPRRLCATMRVPACV
jgi:hypothetical protein